MNSGIRIFVTSALIFVGGLSYDANAASTASCSTQRVVRVDRTSFVNGATTGFVAGSSFGLNYSGPGTTGPVPGGPAESFLITLPNGNVGSLPFRATSGSPSVFSLTCANPTCTMSATWTINDLCGNVLGTIVLTAQGVSGGVYDCSYQPGDVCQPTPAQFAQICTGNQGVVEVACQTGDLSHMERYSQSHLCGVCRRLALFNVGLQASSCDSGDKTAPAISGAQMVPF